MATCPSCCVHGYENDGTFRLEKVLVAKRLGEFSLAGCTPKFVAQERAKLTCNGCGWAVVGAIAEDGQSFIADPEQPSPSLADQGDQLDAGQDA